MTVTIPSVLQASSFCSETGIHLSGKDASTSAVYTSLSSHVPSVFHPKNNFGCSELQAKSARNVVQADVVRAAATFEEGIRQFCLKPFGARKALKVNALCPHVCKATIPSATASGSDLTHSGSALSYTSKTTPHTNPGGSAALLRWTSDINAPTLFMVLVSYRKQRCSYKGVLQPTLLKKMWGNAKLPADPQNTDIVP